MTDISHYGQSVVCIVANLSFSARDEDHFAHPLG